jgi:hypothetical protein
MSKVIPTAEDQLMIYGSSNAIEAMIEFAKLHVEAALKEAAEKAITEEVWGDYYVDKKSILNSYPLISIK